MSLVDNAAVMIADRGESVTLIRTNRAAPAGDTPWQPGAPTTETYTLDAVVKGVAAKYIDGKTIIASDRLLIASPKAKRVSDGVVVDLEPRMTDKLQIGGKETTVKRVDKPSDGGVVAKYRIFVAA